MQGPSDGFLLNLSNDGRGFFPPIGLLLGGSRDDRVLSLSLNGGMLAVVGDTNSPDLNWGPAGKAQSSLAGGKDAFFAFGPAFRVQALPF